MKKAIIAALCILLCGGVVAGAVLFSDNTFPLGSSSKISEKLSDGCWLDYSSEFQIDELSGGIGFVFKPLDNNSGIAVSMNHEEFPYVINGNTIQIFYYNTDDEKYDLMFNAYFSEVQEYEGVYEVLKLTATEAGISYADVFSLEEEFSDIWLAHLEGTKENEHRIRMLFDFWSNVENPLKNDYTNGFTNENTYKEMRVRLSEKDTNASIMKFLQTTYDFGLDDYANAIFYTYDAEDDKWYYLLMNYYSDFQGENNGKYRYMFSFGADSEYSDPFLENAYEYVERNDAFVTANGEGDEFYRITSFSDTELVAPLSEERQAQLDEAIAEASIQLTDWKTAYAEFLTDKLDMDYVQYASFSLGYIDDDDIPELLFASDSSHVSQVEILTLHNGVLRTLGEYGSSGMISYLEKENLICSYGMWQGNSNYEVYELIDDQVVEVWNGSDNQGSAYDESVLSCYSNGQQVSKSEYSKHVEKYFNSAKLKTHGGSNGVSYELTKENINKIIGG